MMILIKKNNIRVVYLYRSITFRTFEVIHPFYSKTSDFGLEYLYNLGHCIQSRGGPISLGKTGKQKRQLKGEMLRSSNA